MTIPWQPLSYSEKGGEGAEKWDEVNCREGWRVELAKGTRMGTEYCVKFQEVDANHCVKGCGRK